MKITDIVILLLFILPGYFCIEVLTWLSTPAKSKKLELKELARLIFWSCPIVFLSGLVLNLWYGYPTLSEMVASFDKFSVLIRFIFTVVLFSFIFGFIGAIINKYWTDFVNEIRVNIFKTYELMPKEDSCWETLITDEPDSRYVEIIKDGKTIAKGFTMGHSFADEEKELILKTPEGFKDYPEIDAKFTKILRSYINLEKGIIINDYDQTEYIKFCEQLNKEQEKQSQ